MYGSYTDDGYQRLRNTVASLRKGGWLAGEPGNWEIAVKEMTS